MKSKSLHPGCRRLLSLTILVTAIVAMPTHPAHPQSSASARVSADEAAARSVWATFDTAWNARDAERIRELFTHDASFRFVDTGVGLEGQEAIDRHFSRQFSTQMPELRHVTDVRDSWLVAPSVVAIDSTVDIVRERSGDSTVTSLRRFAVFSVMLKSAGGWKIHLLRVSPLTSASLERERM